MTVPSENGDITQRPSGLFVVEEAKEKEFEGYNRRRIATAEIIWGVGDAALALCPAFDDFLVWLSIKTQPTLVIPATCEARQFFHDNVAPLIAKCLEVRLAQLKGDQTARVAWLMNMAAHVVDDASNPGALEFNESQELLRATAAIVGRLAEFATRFDAQPEPVR